MDRKSDIVLINPGERMRIYQELGKDYSAIEPPFWIASIAAYLRNNGFNVSVIDANAEDLLPQDVAERVNVLEPLLSAVMVYGCHPSASTQNMPGAQRICRVLRENTSVKVAIGGLHPSALPEKTLQEGGADFIIVGEGHHTLKELLGVLRMGQDGYSKVPGLWYFDNGIAQNNPRAPLVKNADEILPVAAWDLLPMRKYRAHNWHCFDNFEHRAPYGVIYTSLGCPYSCVFCCINALFGKPGIRYRSPDLVMEEIGLLVGKYGIKNLKIADELFILEERHYLKIVDLLIKQNYGLNIWAYARVDSVKPQNLEKMKKAGINWLALGIESANFCVRDSVAKKMKVKDIGGVVNSIKNSGIRVIGNFIFGLPEDTLDTMRETIDMAMDLNCEFANFYCAMAYPGSRLYDIAVEEGWEIPRGWEGFSQHSYETLPLPTKYVSAREVLKFRDGAFYRYFENPAYLNMIENEFGAIVKSDIEEMTKTRLKRRLLEEESPVGA